MGGAYPEQLRFAQTWLEAEEEAGRQFGPELLALAVGAWRSEIARDANLRRYGTLRFVLKEIHDDLFHHPERARDRAAVVIDYAPVVDAPLMQYRLGLVGLAWREYANALRYAGEWHGALRAARRSHRFFGRVVGLDVEAAKAKVIEAFALREFGEYDDALALARACGVVFKDFGDAAAYVNARMIEAIVLSDCSRNREALEILSETAADAERRGDRHTLAICLHNSAEFARALGDLQMAKDLNARALIHFEALGTSVEKPRVRWEHALLLADEGRVDTAISELYLCRAELLGLGMNGDAAACNLDVVRLRFERGEDVTETCGELVATFTHAGMVQNAIEALAYLREQARHGALSEKKISRVREFIGEVVKSPSRVFLPPPDHEVEG